LRRYLIICQINAQKIPGPSVELCHACSLHACNGELTDFKEVIAGICGLSSNGGKAGNLQAGSINSGDTSTAMAPPPKYRCLYNQGITHKL
jgi:hypothetical protein